MARLRGEPLGIAGNHIAQQIRSGVSATAALNALRQEGIAIRTQTWYQAWNSVVHAIREGIDVPTYSLNRRPERSEYQSTLWNTRDRYTYMVNVMLRDRETGLEYTSPFSVTSNRQLTYGGALNEALAYAAFNVDEYGEDVIGGFVDNVYDREL